MKGIEFSKFEGLGNDFIIIENLENDFKLNPKEITKVCNRHFGIGADGIILIEKSKEADFKMVIYNSDGSQAEMCGNGIRCFAKYVYDRGYFSEENIKIEMLAGVKKVRLNFHGSEVLGARVDMGKPSFKPQDIVVLVKDIEEVIKFPLDIGQKTIEVTCVSMGNPHCVLFVERAETAPIKTLGPLIENHQLFPNRTNVEFVEVVDSNTLKVRVWERGVGETLACGTGACASLVAAYKNSFIGPRAVVNLPGGDLLVDWVEGENIYLTGPAKEVFTGIISTDYFSK